MSKFEAGLITTSDPGMDAPLLEEPTVQCVHCGGHFVLKPPKLITKTMTRFEAEFAAAEGKKVRGFCMNCSGYTCGLGCDACVPAMRRA